MDARGLRSLQLTVFGDFLAFGLVFPILPLYAKDRGLRVEEIGLLLACYSLAQLLAAPLWGRLSDRIGRRTPLVVALLGTASSSLLIAAAHGAALLFLAVVLNGASGGSMSVAQAAISDAVPLAERPRALGHLGAGVALGFVLGPALAALSSGAGLIVPFVLAGCLAGANALFATWRLPALPAREVVGTEQGETEPGRNLGALVLVAGLFCVALSFAGFEATFSLLARRHFGFGVRGAGLCFAGLGIVMAGVQGRGLRPLLKHISRAAAIGLGAGGLSAGLLLLGLSAGRAALGVGLVLVGAGYGLLSPLLTSALSGQAVAARRGAVFGVQQAAMSGARVLGPALAALFYARIGPGPSYSILAVVTVLGVVVGLNKWSRPKTAAEVAIVNVPLDRPSK